MRRRRFPTPKHRQKQSKGFERPPRPCGAIFSGAYFSRPFFLAFFVGFPTPNAASASPSVISRPSLRESPPSRRPQNRDPPANPRHIQLRARRPIMPLGQRANQPPPCAKAGQPIPRGPISGPDSPPLIGLFVAQQRARKAAKRRHC